MMPRLDKVTLARKFDEDIEKICADLISAFSLRFKQEVPNLSSPLSRWLDFRYRFIDPQPRKIILSDRFPKKKIPHSAQQALKKMTRAIRLGKDINPYQGRGLKKRNDFSGTKRDSRTDLLWADWGIHHLHLSNLPLPKEQYFSKPADYLLFCIVGGDVVLAVDVLRHPDNVGFSNPELIQTVKRNWPGYMDQFKVNGILTAKELSQADIHQFRSSGLNSTLCLDGQAYISPGMGVTSASTSMKISMAEIHLQRNLEALAEMVCDPDGQFRTSAVNDLSGDVDFSIVCTPRGLAVYESGSGYAFLLPSFNGKNESGLMEMIHDNLLPEWALTQLLIQQDQSSMQQLDITASC